MELQTLEFGERSMDIGIRDFVGLGARGLGVGIKWVAENTDTYTRVIAYVGMWISDDQAAVASEVRISVVHCCTHHRML